MNNPIMYWAMAYKMSDALLTLSETGVLEFIKETDHSAEEIGIELNLSLPTLKPMLELMTSAQIIDKLADKYVMAKNVVNALPMVSLESDLRRWHFKNDSLMKSLRTGQTSNPMENCKDGAFKSKYFMAMSNSMRSVALHIMHLCRLKGPVDILDIGGADGSLALELNRLVSHARFTVVDRDITKPFFNKKIETVKEKERFFFLEKDLFQPDALIDEIERFDVAIMSNILHLLSGEIRQNLLTLLVNKLKPNGKIIIYDQFVNNEHAELDAAQFMVVDWLNCGAMFDVSESEFAEDLKKIGASEVTTKRFPNLPGAMILAKARDRRPSSPMI
jgi:SAM-dependent methyltransferase